MAGVGIWQLVIIALILILLFGTKKLRGLGSDLGESIKGFKNSLGRGEPEILNGAEDAEFISCHVIDDRLNEESMREIKNKN